MFGDRRTRLKIFRLEAMAKIHAFYYTNIKKELLFYGKELLESELKDSFNGSTVSPSQLEYIESHDEFSAFEPISGSSCDSQNLQSDDDNGINDTICQLKKLLIFRIRLLLVIMIHLLKTTNNITRRSSSRNLNYNPASLVARIFNSNEGEE
ncbi:unnamed protein product [Rhizophagus irregularis]|nr:unnamed protein product [Rhizophagus irregularis]